MRKLAVLLALMVLVAGCVSSNQPNQPNNNTSGDKAMQGTKQIVVIETTKGNIEVELDRENAPVTVDNFLRYVNEGFYEGTIFHRVIDGFMIQGGGFTPDGSQKQTHETIKLESNNGLKNEIGTIAMARTSIPDSATSQFFINVADNDFLNYAPGNDGYAVFGKVVAGMDAVYQIKSARTSSMGPYENWPIETIMIKRMYVKN